MKVSGVFIFKTRAQRNNFSFWETEVPAGPWILLDWPLCAVNC